VTGVQTCALPILWVTFYFDVLEKVTPKKRAMGLSNPINKLSEKDKTEMIYYFHSISFFVFRV